MTYTQFYRRLVHLDEIQIAHEQTLQTPGYHYVLCRTSQTPTIKYEVKTA